ncbi:MAG: hypothetical protein P8Z36_11045, partial [Gemmatimonadota bacterium]
MTKKRQKPYSELTEEEKAERRSAAARKAAATRRRKQAQATRAQPAGRGATRMTDADIYLFNEGSHFRLYDKLGAHPGADGSQAGTQFAVWAPNAQHVSVVGDFNGWDPGATPLEPRAESGIWEGFVPDVGPGALYKYHIKSNHNGYRVEKADPFGFQHEEPPRTASVVTALDYDWGDAGWMRMRGERNALSAPLSIY